MHLHSTHTQHLWSDLHLKSDGRSVVEFFFTETVNVFRPVAIYAKELCR